LAPRLCFKFMLLWRNVVTWLTYQINSKPRNLIEDKIFLVKHAAMVVSCLHVSIHDNQWMFKSIEGDLCQKVFPLFGQWVVPLYFNINICTILIKMNVRKNHLHLWLNLPFHVLTCELVCKHGYDQNPNMMKICHNLFLENLMSCGKGILVIVFGNDMLKGVENQ
jgi:hypothetical protein